MFKIMIAILLAGLITIPCRAEFRDPTQPAYPQQPMAAGSGAVVDNEPVLSAIWISAQSRRATINGVSAQQGQTIVIGPVLPLNPKPKNPVNTAAAGNKDELLNKVMEYANAETNHPSRENITAPPGNMIAPLLSAAIGSNKPPPTAAQLSKTGYIPARSSTIKIISIHLNSVVIDQNGELKTLQLVQRSYKTQ